MSLQRLRSTAQLLRLIDGHEGRLYVRYCRGDAADARGGYRSRNYQTNRLEDGLSVEALTPEAWWPHGIRAYVAMQVASYAYFRQQNGRGTRAYIISGDEVGRGADREPIIANPQYLAVLSNDLVDRLIVYHNIDWERRAARLQDEIAAIRRR